MKPYYKNELTIIYNGDCLIETDKIESGSVDLILCDPPYGNMKNAPSTWNKKDYEWDNIITPQNVFEIANRVLRKNGKLILFSQEPYTSKLITQAISNVPFNYRATWVKDNFANALGVNKNMVSFTEDILVFSKHFESESNDDNPCKKYAVDIFNYINKPLKYFKSYYNNSNLSHFYSNGKQFRLCTKNTYENLIKDFNINEMVGFVQYDFLKTLNNDYKNKFKSTFNLWQGGKYKSNILEYKKDYDGFHPTQKPILLLEDLIKTYSNENDTILDFTMGSGSTGVACVNTNRKFIGIELNKEYYDIAVDRITKPKMRLDI